MHNTDERNVMYNRSSCSSRTQCGCKCENTESELTLETSRGCGTGACGNGFGIAGHPLASVYSPLQNFDNIYDCENALIRGTIFMELDLPFVCGGMSGGVCRG